MITNSGILNRVESQFHREANGFHAATAWRKKYSFSKELKDKAPEERHVVFTTEQDHEASPIS